MRTARRRVDRARARALVGDDDFIEIYCQTPIEVCETRDVKGLYKKARAGVIKDFTGVSSPYEAPMDPELMIDTANSTIDDEARQVIVYLKKKLTLSPSFEID